MKTILRRETKVIIAGARLSYANIFEPKAFEGQDPKYSVSLIISKDDTETLDIIDKAIKNAMEQGKSKWGGKVPKNIKLPLHDGDIEREDDESYQNSFYINASSKNAPGVVGLERDRATGKAIPLGSDEVYSGCYANVSVNFYAYDKGSNGISAGLNNIQKCKDGERLGGGAAAAEDDFDFEDVDAEDDFLA